MRLLDVDTLELTDFRDHERPPYAIGSHRWEEEEVTFQDMRGGQKKDKQGFKKVQAFAKYVQEYVSTIKWLWIDTCCINKENAAELSEAINLMFDWYRSAEVCLAYLHDVDSTTERGLFVKSEWFLRGWTLQELLAPKTVVFVTRSWQVIGNKGALSHRYSETSVGPGLESEIAARTGISEQVLHEYDKSLTLAVDTRLSWMDDRKTSREEDLSYALFGIFNVTTGANYGEKREGARERLLAAIHQRDNRAAQQAAHFRKIVDWRHDSARQLHQPQTGIWLLQSDHYQKWISGSARHLWMYGKVGCGKTILCSTAVEHVKSYCEQRANAGFAVFYCSFADDRKQRHVDLLRSLVAQLGWKGPALSMLQQAHNKPNRSFPGADELEKILLACFEAYKETFVLIDALDECPEDDNIRHTMLECLAQLSQKSDCTKIFATSRKSQDIQASMAKLGAEPISIATDSMDIDIRRYMTTQLLRDYRLSRLDVATKTLIEEAISEKANGMFRWAYCQLQELKKLKSTRPKFVQEALYSLPTTLDETYERMLIGIGEELHTDALTLLRWIAYAKSPPSLAELVHATVIDVTGEGHVDLGDCPGLEDTLEILSGLVIAVRNKGTTDYPDYVDDAGPKDYDDECSEFRQQIVESTRVRLAHFSVKEYVESKQILESSARDFHFKSAREHRTLSQSCLVYLMHYSGSTEKASTEVDLATFPLLHYAAKSWFYHLFLQGTEEATQAANLLRNAVVLRDWLQVHQPDQPWHRAFEKPKGVGSGLYYASFLGLEQAVRDLLSIGADVNALGGLYGNALQAASYRGDEKVVQMLIDAGADVNAQGGPYGNALQAASYRGDEKVVQILIDTGADVNAQGRLSGNALGNALQAALERGHEKVVQMLMDAEADLIRNGENS